MTFLTFTLCNGGRHKLTLHRFQLSLSFSIKKGRLDEAEKSLLRVFGSDYDAKQDVINISENLQHLRNVRQSDTFDYSLRNFKNNAFFTRQIVVKLKLPCSNYAKCIEMRERQRKLNLSCHRQNKERKSDYMRNLRAYPEVYKPFLIIVFVSLVSGG